MEPERTCLGCRARAVRSSLLRMVVQSGEIIVDSSATLPGRGAWVHPSIECVDRAIQRKALGRALRRPDAVLDRVALDSRLAAGVLSTDGPEESDGSEPDRADQPGDDTPMRVRPVTN